MATPQLFQRGDNDWEALASTVLKWLNDYLPPHALINVTFFEEAHPNESGKICAVVTHRIAEDLVKLPQSPAGKAIPVGGIYTMDTFDGESNDIICPQMMEQMNRRGGQEGHVVAITNDSESGNIFGAVFSWNTILEEQIEECLRPATCAACTIF